MLFYVSVQPFYCCVVFHCVTVLQFILLPSLAFQYVFAEWVCDCSIWCESLPRPVSVPDPAHLLKPNSSPLDTCLSLCLPESALPPSSLNCCDKESRPQACGSSLWAILTRYLLFQQMFIEHPFCTLHCSGYWGYSSEQRAKTSKTASLHGASIPVHAASTALCLLDPDARSILVLFRLLCPVGFYRS